jgi:hypothetical protein
MVDERTSVHRQNYQDGLPEDPKRSWNREIVKSRLSQTEIDIEYLLVFGFMNFFVVKIDVLYRVERHLELDLCRDLRMIQERP